MAQDLDQIVVLELTSSCWESAPPPGLEPEILAIGVCTVDVVSLEVGVGDDILIRPTARITSYCQDVTGLTNTQLDGGLPLAEALELLMNRHQTHQRMCATWNADIPRELELLSKMKGFPYPLSDSFMNIMTVFASSHGFGREVSLPDALKELGATYKGHPLSVADRAYNGAHVLSRVLGNVRSKGRRRRSKAARE